jgi:hypothetical protein
MKNGAYTIFRIIRHKDKWKIDRNKNNNQGSMKRITILKTN